MENLTGPGQTLTFQSSLGGGVVTGLFDIDAGNFQFGVDPYFGYYYLDAPLLLLHDSSGQVAG